MRGGEWNRAGKCALNQGGVRVGVCRRLSPKKRLNKPKLGTNNFEPGLNARGRVESGGGMRPELGERGRVVADAGAADEEKRS
jgi:hypothetical protein